VQTAAEGGEASLKSRVLAATIGECCYGIAMSTPLFDPKTFLAKAAVTTYPGRQVIFAQGEPADAIFYLMAGRVKRTVVSKKGKEAVLDLFRPGEIFGEGCMTNISANVICS
jgi:CRP-like cAMP-binding protein